jgi:NAD(P)-dependent dehydrogenase (short-subunit alcohol dehydrogenase family)
MEKTILVAGATGNLGKKICRELIGRGTSVNAIIRNSADDDKISVLEAAGVKVYKVDFSNADELTKAFTGVDCVVSALAGLEDVIIDLQKTILDAAVKAGVPRFIPSDFCTNYNALVPGENRNFDLRRRFRAELQKAPIKASSVFNGAFADILKYNTPILNLKDRSIAYWGDKSDWRLDFTTMDNTAAFTAEVALDDSAPRDLQIASFQVSPAMIRSYVKEATGEEFSIQQLSGLEDFAKSIKKQRAEYPAGEQELYAKWQQGQYMYSMFSTQHSQLDNDRYKSVEWTTAPEYISSFVK